MADDELRYEPIHDGSDEGQHGADDASFESDAAQNWAFPVAFAQPHEVIRASAGSGKTYQLSNRYLGLLRNTVLAEQILATTFTRKAAGEILERILTRLADAADNDAAAHELAQGLAEPTLDRAAARSMLASLCHSLHRVAVSTIDSFFSRVAQVFRHELRLPPEPVMAGQDDPTVIQLRARAIEAMLGDDDTQTLVGLLRRLHHDNAQRSVTGAIDDIVSGLYENYRMTEPAAWERLEAGTPLDDDALAAAIDVLEGLTTTVTQKYLLNAIGKSVIEARSGDWKSFIAKGPPACIAADPASPMYSKKPIPEDIVAAYRPLVDHAKAVQVGLIRQRTLAMLELMQKFDVHFTRLREASHVLLYADLPHRLLAYMQGIDTDDGQWNSDLHYRLDTRVSNLLLDEFQDTSFDQWAVLKPFADEITAMTDQSRSFFCVGDVKQAIYGWRGGRAEIFDRLRDDLHLDEQAIRQLNDNYRSSQDVLDVVNCLFSGLTNNAVLQDDELFQHEAKHWRSLFDDHNAKRSKVGYVELTTTPAPPVDDDDSDPASFSADGSADSSGDGDDDEAGGSSASHLEAVAQRIKELHEQSPQFSVGVLASRNKTVNTLLYLLGSRGVPVSGEGGVAIAGDPAINLIMAALQLADHPGDRVAGFALFNSPMREALPLDSTAIRDCDDASWKIRQSLSVDGYAVTIERWAAALAGHCDERSARRLTQLIDLADRFDPGEGLRVRDFIDYIEGAAVEEPSAAGVRVMTIHKAKGLEFDIVVLPELKSELGKVSTNAVLTAQDDATGKVREVHAYASKDVRALSPQLIEAYRQEHARRIREGLCVLYVAMTRARHALHMMVEPLKKKKNGDFAKAGYADHSFAAILRAGLMDDDVIETEAGGQVLFAHGDAEWFKHTKAGESPPPQTVVLPQFAIAKTKAGQTKLRARNLPSVSPSSMHGGDERKAGDLFDIKPSPGRQRGSVMHKWFEQIEWLDANEPDSALPDVDWFALGRSALAGPVADDWLAEQFERFKTMLQHDAVCNAFAKPAVEASEGGAIELWRERAFAVTLDGRLLKGMFDRVVIHRDGSGITKIEVIDFKTDDVGHVANGAANNAAGHSSAEHAPAIAARVAIYRPQMEAYRAAIGRLLRVDASVVDVSLLFVQAGVRITVE